MCVTASEITVHQSDVLIRAMASGITSVSIDCFAVCSGADQRKHPRSVSLAFARGNPPFDDVITRLWQLFVLMTLQTINEWNLKAPHSLSFVSGMHGWAVDSPYKGPVIMKAFRCHGATMGWRNYVFRMTHVVISMTTTWPAGSVAPNTKKKHPQSHYAGNLALNILQQSFTVGSWDGMVMCSAPRTVSNLSQTYRSQGPDDT